MTLPPPIEAAAWACALATVLWQRLLLPSCLLTWDLLSGLQAEEASSRIGETPLPGGPKPCVTGGTAPASSTLRQVSPALLSYPQHLECLTRRQLQELAGTKRNLPKAELLRRIRADLKSAWARYYKPVPPSRVQPVPLR